MWCENSDECDVMWCENSDECDYGLLIQGDIGKLCFQGTRYLGFERS